MAPADWILLFEKLAFQAGCLTRHELRTSIWRKASKRFWLLTSARDDMSDTPSANRTGDPVDRHVGARLRLCRHARGTKQTELASAIGLTFQQIQKYENGSNRINASKLYAIAAVLRTPISQPAPFRSSIVTSEIPDITETCGGRSPHRRARETSLGPK